MKGKIVFECGCGVVTSLSLGKPLHPGQIVGCLSCGQTFEFAVRPTKRAVDLATTSGKSAVVAGQEYMANKRGNPVTPSH
jgi:transcription elongation factor Elf1